MFQLIMNKAQVNPGRKRNRWSAMATRSGATPDLIDGTNGKLLHASAEDFSQKICTFAQITGAEWCGFSEVDWHIETPYNCLDPADLLHVTFPADMSRPHDACAFEKVSL
jgi:hypothetical protein